MPPSPPRSDQTGRLTESDPPPLSGQTEDTLLGLRPRHHPQPRSLRHRLVAGGHPQSQEATNNIKSAKKYQK